MSLLDFLFGDAANSERTGRDCLFKESYLRVEVRLAKNYSSHSSCSGKFSTSDVFFFLHNVINRLSQILHLINILLLSRKVSKDP